MLINLRNALMTGKRLPYDAELEYIESHGTEWIDTRIVVDGLTFAMQIGLQYASVVSSYSVHGQSANDRQVRFGCGMYNSKWYFGLGNKNYYPAWYADANRHILTLDAPGGIASVDSNVLNVSDSSWEAYTGLKYPLSVFARRNQDGGQISAYFSGKVYFCKIWNSGTLVRDFIPVRKGTVGYLYDRVSGKLFGNVGTGDFVLGPDVVPVEYIESHGTEYIDTGYIPTMATKWVTDIQWTSTDWSQITGIRNGVGSQQSRFAVGRDNSGFGNGWVFTTGNVANWVGTFDTNRHTFAIDMPNGTASIDATSYSTGATALSTTGTIFLMAMRNASGVETFVTGRLFGSQIFDNGILSRDYKPIRVGTEGAMMDVLTRRIYRNAGTGAFTYGNDLKYPIPSE